MKNRILLVDDERMLLESLRRELGLKYDFDTACSGMDALEKLRTAGPYAVVIADYRMPGMNGVQFLTRVMEEAPDTVRMMLTGTADMQVAMEAINQGNIFRFMTKPCNGERLSAAIEAGLQQYGLLRAEKDLLEKTLTESVNMLVEVLAIVNPKAYGRSLRIRQHVVHIVKHLKIENGWQYEVAAALSQLGWIIFPQHMVDKITENKQLTPNETLLFSKHSYTTGKLLENIPRLEKVARIIAGQASTIDDLCLDQEAGEKYEIDFGSHILYVCTEYDQLQMDGWLHEQILDRMKHEKAKYHPKVIEALSILKSYRPDIDPRNVEVIRLDDLDVGMFLVEPILDAYGNKVLDGGKTITRSMLIKLFSTVHSTVLERAKIIRNWN